MYCKLITAQKQGALSRGGSGEAPAPGLSAAAVSLFFCLAHIMSDREGPGPPLWLQETNCIAPAGLSSPLLLPLPFPTMKAAEGLPG